MTALRALRAATLALGAVLAAFFVYVVVVRALRPVELEWMTGAILDHVERVRAGQPIYGPPSLDFIPCIYPPLYYWVAAALAGHGSVLVACRVVSVVATFASAGLVYLVARTLGASRYFALVGVSLFAGAYSYTGYFYDLERCDALVVALILAATLALVRAQSARGATAAGVLFGLAILTKQQAFVVTVAATLGLIVAREKRRAAALAGAAFVVAGGAFAWLEHATNGWFAYYVLSVPSAHGLDSRFLTLFLVSDLAQAFALTAASVAVLVGATTAFTHRESGAHLEVGAIAFAAVVAGALVAAGTSRLHVGGYVNVLMPWAALGCVAFSVAASRIETRSEGSRTAVILVCSAALLQLMRFAYDPGEAVPTAVHVRAASALEARVRALETQGEVIVHGEGHLTARPHFHAVALQDVLRAGGSLPDDIVRGFRDRRFAAFILDDFHELTLERLVPHTPFFALVTSSYYVAERLDDRAPPPVVGWPEHPTWVLRPRTRPLEGWSDEALSHRQAIEAALADGRMRLRRAGVADAASETTEIEAARLDGAR